MRSYSLDKAIHHADGDCLISEKGKVVDQYDIDRVSAIAMVGPQCACELAEVGEFFDALQTEIQHEALFGLAYSACRTFVSKVLSGLDARAIDTVRRRCMCGDVLRDIYEDVMSGEVGKRVMQRYTNGELLSYPGLVH